MLLCFLAFQPAAVVSSRVSVATSENPMRRIITMLQDMAKEVAREGEIEKEIFDKALCACEGGDKDLQKVIDDSTVAIEETTSKIESETAEQAQLTQEIADHKTNAETAKKDLEQATMLREKDNKKFVAEEKDTKLNLKGLGQAIPAIEKGMGGASLMQLSGSGRLRRLIEITKYLSSDERSGVL